KLWTDLRWHLVIAEAAGRVIGVVTGSYLGNVNTGVIGYLAVARSARRLGVGPKLRARLRTLFERDARQILRRPLQAVVGEVRRDNPWLRTLIRAKRVLALDFPYFQPQLRRGDGPVPLVFYYESCDRSRRRLSATMIRRLLYTIWRRLYRIARPLSDPAFRQNLQGLSNRRSVGEIKLKVLAAPPAH
ncbi:MAG: GNAT family N-acetyltransferase, partial [Gemmatimonadota bacterium]|nr:GNAT family N-acetyltransferase [Gemmatimonadota bacterium]